MVNLSALEGLKLQLGCVSLDIYQKLFSTVSPGIGALTVFVDHVTPLRHAR